MGAWPCGGEVAWIGLREAVHLLFVLVDRTVNNTDARVRRRLTSNLANFETSTLFFVTATRARVALGPVSPSQSFFGSRCSEPTKRSSRFGEKMLELGS